MKALAVAVGARARSAPAAVVVGRTRRRAARSVPARRHAGRTSSSYAVTPSSIDVAPGTTVCWTNNDAVPHTVDLRHAGVFDSGQLRQNDIVPTHLHDRRHLRLRSARSTHVHDWLASIVGSAPPPPPPPPPPGPPPPPPPPSPPLPPPAPPPPTTTRVTVSGFRVGVQRKNGRRWVVARARLNRAAAGELRLLRRSRTVARMRQALRRGQNTLRLRVPARASARPLPGPSDRRRAPLHSFLTALS